MTNEVNWWLETYKLIPVGIFGAIAAGIAHRQWKTAHDKLRLDLFDRRVVIFQEADDFIRKVMHSDVDKWEDLVNFQKTRVDAEFLFGKDVTSELEVVDKRAMELWSLKKTFKQVGPYRDPQDEADSKMLREQLTEHRKTLPHVFSPYLRFENQLGRRTWYDCFRDYIGL